MRRDFDLILEDEVEQVDPLYKNVLCIDGGERDTGSVRIPPDVIEQMGVDYNSKFLPQDSPSIDGCSPFTMSEENQFVVFESADFTDGHRLHRKLWTSIRVKNLNDLSYREAQSDEYGVVVGSYPNTYEVNPMALYCPERDVAALELLNVEGDVEGEAEYVIYDLPRGEIIRSISLNGIDFYDVPDEVLLRHVPEEYNPDVVANNI